MCNFFVFYCQALYCRCCPASYGVKGNFWNQFLFFLPLTTQGSTFFSLFFFFHGPAICNCIHLFDSHSLMFCCWARRTMKSLWTKARRGWWTQLSLNCSLDLMRVQSRGHPFEAEGPVWCILGASARGWAFACLIISYLVRLSQARGAAGSEMFFFFLLFRVCARKTHMPEFVHIHIAGSGCSSQSISGGNYRTLPPSNSLKWAWHYRRNIPFAN